MTFLPASLATRRDETAARRRLVRELADYSTPAEVNDLLTLISRNDDPMAEDVRTILADNLRRCA